MIIESTTLSIRPPDNLYIMSYIPLMIHPKNLAIGPRNLPESAVNSMADIYTSIHHYGTGSYPPLEKGLHLKILQKANAPPLIAPYFCTASRP